MGKDNTWSWVDALPEGLDETKAVVYQQVVNDNIIQLGGEHYLFEDGQVWWSKNDRWKRGIVTAANLADESMFTPVTA